MDYDKLPVAFPKTEYEALALLWVKQHAGEAKSPEELLEMYREAVHRIETAP